MMDKKKPPQTPEMKAFLENLEKGLPPRKKLEISASVMTAHIIMRIQQQSRLKK
jgi:hypothetical protein